MNSTQQEQVTEKNWQFVKSFQINVNRTEWQSENLDGYLYVDPLGFRHIEVWQDANYFVGGSIEVKDLTLKAKIDCVYFETGSLFQALLADQIISPVQHFVGFVECRLSEQVNQPLQQYPHKIAATQIELLDLNLAIDRQTQILAHLDTKIEIAIATDSSLKNEQLRKAKRSQLRQQPEYLETRNELNAIKEEKERLAISLKLLKNQFSVAKLELKLTIAQMESSTAA